VGEGDDAPTDDDTPPGDDADAEAGGEEPPGSAGDDSPGTDSDSATADGAAGDGVIGAGDGGEDDPMAGLAREVERRRGTDEPAGSDGTVEDLFDEVDVGEIDSEAVWEEVMAGETESEPGVGGVGAAEAVETGPAVPGEEHLLEKRQYCQQCPHFADPPDVRCTHEGTHIVEVADLDRFRVRNCPMVTESELREPEDGQSS